MSNKAKYGISVDKNPNGWWSFAIGISHMDKETYIFIKFLFWQISIGKICK